MNEAAALSSTWMKDDEYAARIKDVAARTPIRQREEKLVASLGKIIGINVISFKEGIFFSRVTTDSRIYRASIALDKNNMSMDSAVYDPWSIRWTPHAHRLVALHVVKDAIDPDKLQASINEQLRKLYISENSNTWAEQNIIYPEPVPFSEPSAQLATGSLFCAEQMEEEEEEQVQLPLKPAYNYFGSF